MTTRSPLLCRTPSSRSFWCRLLGTFLRLAPAKAGGWGRHGRLYSAVRYRTVPALFTFLAGIMTLWPAPLEAHPFHISVGEVELNRKTGKLEIALKLNPLDLEKALTERAPAPVDLDKTKNVDHLISAYLKDRIIFTGPDKQPKKLLWVGKEVSAKDAWLFFEVKLQEPLDSITITNRVFFKLLPDQTNVLNLKDGKRKVSLKFTRKKPRQKIVLPD